MIQTQHNFNLKGLPHTANVVESLEGSDSFNLDDGICYVERITETSRQRLAAFDPRLRTTNTQYEYSILETVEDLTVPFMVKKNAATPTFYVRKDLTIALLNAPTGGESQAEFLGKMLVRGLCERFYDEFKHDIVPYYFSSETLQFVSIQPLTFTLSTGADSVTVNVVDSENIANIKTSIDGGVTWSTDLAYNGLSTGDYTILVKEREEVILKEEFSI